MDEKELSKVFATKLSLPKFICMMKSLTNIQRELVQMIGFEHLLYLSCDQLPRGLIIYLVTNFDVEIRSLKLPNGSSFIITPDCINKVLGTPIGGRNIGQKPDSELKSVVADLTKCKGQYPTISELDSLITPELDGDEFKLIYTMFAMTAFLCPSSHDALSPMYLHIFKNADEILLFDFSSAILEKLVSSIKIFKERSSSVLGGNLLSLMAIYFEFIDTDIIPRPSKSVLPRLSIWTSSLVSKIETMDCVCKINSQYGRLPIKDVSDTLFGYIFKKEQAIVGKSYKDLLDFVLSICPYNHHSVVKEQLPLIMENMGKEVLESIEPIFVEKMLNVMSMIQISKSMKKVNNPSCSRTLKVLSNESAVIEHPCCSQINSKVCESGNRTSSPVHLEDTDFHVVTDCRKQSSNKDDLPVITDCRKQATKKDDSLSMQKEAVVANHQLLLPVPSDESLHNFNDESFSKLHSSVMQSLIDSLKSIQVSSEIDLPYNQDLIESMYPKKDDTAYFDKYMSSTTDILSYLLDEVQAYRNLTMSKDSIDSFVFEKVDFMDDFDDLIRIRSYNSSMIQQSASNPHKRSSKLLTNDSVSHCVAVEKRAKLFQLNEDYSVRSENPLGCLNLSLAGSHDHIETSESSKANSTMKHHTMIRSPEKVVAMNFAIDGEQCAVMSEAEWEIEFLNSALQTEAKHLAKKKEYLDHM